jgi:hypothetical protein
LKINKNKLPTKKSKNKKIKKIERKLADYQKYGNLPTIQILIIIKYKLRHYYKKVKIKNENILDVIDFYSYPLDSCPICGAKNCARFIGCYEREVIDEEGNYYKDFPIPRFLCQGKGKNKLVNHKTFSLLHYHLVPYWKYSIPFIIKVLKARHIDGMALDIMLNYIDDFTTNDQYYVELSLSRFFSFQHLIEEAIAKIMANGYYPEINPQLQSPRKNQQIKAFLKFALEFYCYKLNCPIRGPCALSVDFYLRGGSYLLNSHFLFGTPSQFRR